MESKAQVVLHGKSYPLIGPSEFTLGDLVDCENHFGATYASEEMNARKLAGILYISVRRIDATVQPGDVRNLTGQQLEELNEQLQKWEAEDDVGPPGNAPEPSASESASNGSSGDSSSPGSDPLVEAPSSTGSLPLATGAI